jgi:tellurite resistance protein
MGQLLMPSLIEIFKSARDTLFCLIADLKFTALSKIGFNQSAELYSQIDPKVLNCRVQLTKQKKDNIVFDAFTVKICGSIHAPSNMHYTTLRIFITDVTNGIHRAEPVRSCVKKWQMQDSPVFCYTCDLGKLPEADTILSDWITAAHINLDWLALPRKGERNLQFSTSILSAKNGRELAEAACIFTYRSPTFGYADFQENIQRKKTLAVTLAFAVGAAHNRLSDCETAVIKDWVRNKFDSSQVSNRARRKLDRALDEAIRFFREGCRIDIYETCKQIAEIAPVADRYEILDLCLHVVQADGVASMEELILLKNMADWLEVDTERFRGMMEQVLPVGMHEVEDAEVVLGVTSDMSKEKTRKHLNKEYRKWNSRVTNTDPEVQTQADQMLKFIAEARNQYIG